MASEHLSLRGILKGHNGWVTSIATSSESPDTIVSGSRDKTLIIWNLTKDNEPGVAGVAHKSLTGHAHFIQDLVLSSDGQFALTSSWDNTLRLWDLNAGVTTRTFNGHKKDVLSVAFSSDNRHIVSGSRDRTIKLWNTLGDCKHTIDGEGSHSDWVTCVRFSPAPNNLIVSGSVDKTVKVWNLKDCQLKFNLTGHEGNINTVTVSPDGSLCASGGKDNVAMLWELNEGKHLSTLTANNVINALAFSPNRYWLVAGTNTGIRIWDLEKKTLVTELLSTFPGFFPLNRVGSGIPACVSLAWSHDGTTLFAGYTDNLIRVWEVKA